MKTAIAAAMMIVALGGCHRSSPQDKVATPAPLATATPSTADDYLQRINRLPQKQRDVTFFRAIDDAGFECQGVKASERRSDVQGYPAWVAHCIDGRDWVVVLEANGTVQVATPAQVRGAKVAGAPGNESGR
ncbi:hypothetical protein GCM10009087_28620 [Sphingomonas oligophenolica]|uniref:Lipoprotein n=1 Tax=Sphingomonas oligophenolica TaxID=301154 RepID=A0ABU9Y8D0_9SPHN